MRHQHDGHDRPITLSHSVVATCEGLSGVFQGSLRAKSPEAHSQVSGWFDILGEITYLVDLLGHMSSMT